MSNDAFLRDTIKKIKNEFDYNYDDMYEIISSVGDLFASPYLNKSIANIETIEELWNTLLEVFLSSKSFDNKFESISVMFDIQMYGKKFNIPLELNSLKKWYNDNEHEHEDILECVEEILLELSN